MPNNGEVQSCEGLCDESMGYGTRFKKFKIKQKTKTKKPKQFKLNESFLLYLSVLFSEQSFRSFCDAVHKITSCFSKPLEPVFSAFVSFMLIVICDNFLNAFYVSGSLCPSVKGKVFKERCASLQLTLLLRHCWKQVGGEVGFEKIYWTGTRKRSCG